MNGDEVQLRLPARPENVALVRQALSGIGDTFAVEPALLADMKTAVTEACNNVVLHAYSKNEGMLEVDASPDDERVTVIVRDYGDGMQPRSIQPDEPSLGLGLPLIAALSHQFEIRGGTGRGIEVRMMFLVDDEAEAPNRINDVVEAEAPTGPARQSGEEATKATGIAITPGRMMAPVLGRLAAMLASRADFSLERLSDAVLVTDAISAHVSSYITRRHVSIAFEDGDGMLNLRVGPLLQGGAQGLLQTMELPGLNRSLEQLADEVDVERGSEDVEESAGDEYLVLRLTAH